MFEVAVCICLPWVLQDLRLDSPHLGALLFKQNVNSKMYLPLLLLLFLPQFRVRTIPCSSLYFLFSCLDNSPLPLSREIHTHTGKKKERKMCCAAWCHPSHKPHKTYCSKKTINAALFYKVTAEKKTGTIKKQSLWYLVVFAALMHWDKFKDTALLLSSQTWNVHCVKQGKGLNLMKNRTNQRQEWPPAPRETKSWPTQEGFCRSENAGGQCCTGNPSSSAQLGFGEAEPESAIAVRFGHPATASRLPGLLKSHENPTERAEEDFSTHPKERSCREEADLGTAKGRIPALGNASVSSQE